MTEVPNDNHHDATNDQGSERQPGNGPLRDDPTLGDFSVDPVRGTEADSGIGGGDALSGAAFSDPHEETADDTGREDSPETTERGTAAGRAVVGHETAMSNEGNRTEGGNPLDNQGKEETDTAADNGEADASPTQHDQAAETAGAVVVGRETGGEDEVDDEVVETDQQSQRPRRRTILNIEVGEHTILEGTRAIFDRTHKPTPEYVDSVYAENFPSLVVIGGTAHVPELDEFNYTAPVLVTAESYARIEERAKHIIEIPHAFEGGMEPEELGVIQKWLEGVVYEMTEDENAAYVGLSERTLKRVTQDMRQYLGAPNQASAVYSMLLHGHEQGQVHQYETPPMESTQKFHLLLTGMGFTEKQAAQLVTVDNNNPVSVSRVKRYRQDAYSELHAEQSGYALVNAFRAGIFTPISR